MFCHWFTQELHVQYNVAINRKISYPQAGAEIEKKLWGLHFQARREERQKKKKKLIHWWKETYTNFQSFSLIFSNFQLISNAIRPSKFIWIVQFFFENLSLLRICF